MNTFFKVSEVQDIFDANPGMRNGEVFGVTFEKRTNGEVRNMAARNGVIKHLKGGDLNYDPKKKNLLIVFDMNKKGYRSIPLDRVMEIKVGGKAHKA
jgi:hypothetical protein